MTWHAPGNGRYDPGPVVTDRDPPQSLVAEEGVIGSALLDPALLGRLRAILDRDDFYLEAHAILWDVACRMGDRGEAIDLITLVECLKRDGTLDRVGDEEFLAHLYTIPSSCNGEYYARIVRDHAEARRVIEVADSILREAYDRRYSGAELARIAQGRIEALAAGGPIDDFAEPPAWPAPIGRAAYLGCVGDFVDRIGPHSEADPAALLVTFLTFAGNLIGPRAYMMAEGSRHRANLYTCVVGDTAKARKGVSVRRVRQSLEADFPAYLTDQVARGLASGEGLINAVRDDVVDRAGEIKVEGVLDKRLLLIEEEFASVLTASGRDGSTLSMKLREAWDSTDLRHMTRKDPLRATGTQISLLAHITLTELETKLRYDEHFNGFANRILWVCARRARVLPHGGNPERGWRDDLAATIRAAREFAQDDRHDQPHAWDPDARELWGVIYTDLTRPRPGLVGAVTSRGEAYCLRLALLYAMLDPAGPSILVRPWHLEAAREVWRYCEDSAIYLFHGKEDDPDASKVLRALKEAPLGLTRTQISGRAFGRNKSRDQLDAILTRLIRRGRLRRVIEETGGRPAERWELTGGPEYGA